MKAISTAPRVLYYALGGGRGHLTRSLWMAQFFPQVRWLVPVRLAHWVNAIGLEPQSSQSLAQRVQSEIDHYQPDLLVVDTFPRGVLGELARVHWDCPAWLVSRWVKPEYAALAEVQQALRRYFKIAVELTAWPCDFELGPALRPPPQHRTASDNRVLCLLDPPDWLASWCQQRGLQLLGPDLEAPCAQAQQLLPQAQLIISGAGYNSYHEVVQSGVPAIFLAQPRCLDDQQLRARGLLGPKPRGWHRLGGLHSALEEWWQEKPKPLAPLQLARPELLESLVQHHIFGADHVTPSA